MLFRPFCDRFKNDPTRFAPGGACSQRACELVGRRHLRLVVWSDQSLKIGRKPKPKRTPHDQNSYPSSTVVAPACTCLGPGLPC
jgi:hypothetical protein